jgi:arylsulfatase A
MTRFFSFAILAALLSSAEGVLRAATTGPNVVYIIADDHAYRDFGFMGSKEALTPHLDKLASQSALFTHGYVPTSLCSPSLAVMLTGRYPHQSGIHYNHPPPGNSAFNKMSSRTEYERVRSHSFSIIQSQPALPRTLAGLGYESLQTGKFWEGHFSNAGFTDGMTLFLPREGQEYGGNRTLQGGALAAHGNGDHGLQIGRETMEPIAAFLDRCGREQPFFLWYAPYLPHQPHDSPQRFFELYRGRGIAEHRIPYLASVSQFDDTVGTLVDMVEKRGLAANTLFVFVSDNGWSPSTTPDKKSKGEFTQTRESKYSPFEDGLRTPILLRWDGRIKPGVHEDLVSSVDLLPTVLDALGKPQAIPALPGRSLLPAATGSGELEQRPVFGEIYPGDATSLGHPSRDIAYRWIRDGKYKLIVPHTQHGNAPWRDYVPVTSLFDLSVDPQERDNLAGKSSHAATVAHLKQQLDAWWKADSASDNHIPQAGL